jgi:hypothetical protein
MHFLGFGFLGGNPALGLFGFGWGAVLVQPDLE